MDVRILGALEAHDGERVLDLGLRKARMLFAALALAPRTPIRSERLAEALWPAGPPPRWESALHSHISRLRNALEPDRAARSPSTRLETRGDAYVLHLADDELDARRFERFASDGRAAMSRGEHGRAFEFFERALAEWRGPVLADLADAPFVTADATRLDELRLVVREERVEAELALGRHATAVADLETLVGEHPLRERCWELLLLALYRSGRQADALRRYQDVRSVLVDELGIEPGPALRELESSILRQDEDLRGAAPVRVVAREAATTTFPAWLRPPDDVFVGRDDEVDVLAREWKRTAGGARRFVVVDGEPGIGKTRLVCEVCREFAGEGALVLGGRCPEEPLHALQPFAEAIGRYAVADAAGLADALPNEIGALVGLVPELAAHATPVAMGDADAQTYLLYRAVSAVLDVQFTGRPVLLVLDDVHWAPPATLRLLAHLLRDDDRGPLFVLATARDTEPRHDLDALIADMRREHRMERVALAGLDLDHVNALALARGSADAPTRLYGMTDGNPFYVEELVRHVAESGGALADDSVPDSVRDTIARRLLRLPDQVRRVLGVAAVAGQEFRLDVLAIASEITIDDADDALLAAGHAGVVQESAARAGIFTFSHALIRTVLRDGLGGARQARVHRRLGDALIEVGGDPAEIARHLLAAASDGSDALPGIAYAREAAQLAIDRFTYDDATALFEAALRRVEVAEPGSVLECELRLELGGALRLAGRYDDLETHYERAYAIAIALDDPVLIGTAILEAFTGTTLAPPDWARRAEVALERLPDDTPLWVLLTSLLAHYWSRLPGERGRDLAERALARVPMLEPAARSQVLEFTIPTIGAWSPVERMVDLARAKLDAAQAAKRPGEIVTAFSVLRRWYLAAGDLAKSDETARQYEDLVRTMRAPRFLAGVEQRRAMSALLAGRFTEAEAHAEEAVNLQPNVEFIEGLAVQLFAMRLEQGRLDEVREAVENWAAAPETRAAWRIGLGALYAEIGELDGARSAVAPYIADRFASVPHDELWFLALAAASVVALAVGDDEAASLVYELLAPQASRVIVAGEGAVCWGSIHRILAPLAAQLGHVERASTHYEAAMAVHERLGARPFLARDRLGYARLLRETGGDDVRIAHLARTGLAIANELGMRAVVDRNGDLVSEA